MEGQALAAAADLSEKISFETMIVGLLTKQILPDATVLGFSRSGSFFNREFLKGKSELYAFEALSWKDVKTFIEEILLRKLPRLRNFERKSSSK